MELRGNWLTITCFLCSIIGLILIYLAALNIQPVELRLSEINFELVGRAVKTTGYISYKRTHPAGHIFLTVSDGSASIQVPLFAGFVSSLNNNGFDTNELKKGSAISVEGLVDEYKGQLQIIPRTPDDIEFLSDSYDN